MAIREKRPIKEGLWVDTADASGAITLIGSQCRECGEVHFPRCEMGFCSYCQSRAIDDIELGTRGKIYAHTIIMQRPPVYYQGPVPYAIGFVELPEGVRVETHFTDCDFEDLRVGLDVELVLRTLYQDDSDTDVETYMFRPVAQ